MYFSAVRSHNAQFSDAEVDHTSDSGTSLRAQNSRLQKELRAVCRDRDDLSYQLNLVQRDHEEAQQRLLEQSKLRIHCEHLQQVSF